MEDQAGVENEIGEQEIPITPYPRATNSQQRNMDECLNADEEEFVTNQPIEDPFGGTRGDSSVGLDIGLGLGGLSITLTEREKLQGVYLKLETEFASSKSRSEGTSKTAASDVQRIPTRSSGFKPLTKWQFESFPSQGVRKKNIGRTSTVSRLARRSPRKYLAVPAVEFQLFQRLPVELRIMIWTQCANIPRTVLVTSKRTGRTWKIVSTAVPAVLHVNHDSRKTGVKVLNPIFNSMSRTDFKAVYFNLELDTLSLSLQDAKKLAVVTDEGVKADRESIKNIEVIFDIEHNIMFYEAIAHLVLRAPFIAWPSAQTWRFPGLRGKTVITYVDLLVQRPVSLVDSEDPDKERQLAARIETSYTVEKSQHGTDKHIGLHIIYTTHSSSNVILEEVHD